MAKVTVYVTDEQLERLKSARGVGGKGGMSKAFQAFLEQVIGGGSAPAGRYDYARKLMPVSAAIDRRRRLLARKVADGGPPADGGPVAAALTVLLYRRLLEQDPALEAGLEKEFLRFGLDELVAAETEGVDLLAEPEDDDVEIDEDAAGPTAFGINLGEELRGVTEAIRTADAIRENFLGRRESRHRGGPTGGPPRPPRPPRPGGGGGGRSRRVEISISPSDDPREVLTVTEYERFTKRHDDWTPGTDLTPSQIESVVDFLRERVNRELDEDDE